MTRGRSDAADDANRMQFVAVLLLMFLLEIIHDYPQVCIHFSLAMSQTL